MKPPGKSKWGSQSDLLPLAVEGCGQDSHTHDADPDSGDATLLLANPMTIVPPLQQTQSFAVPGAVDVHQQEKLEPLGGTDSVDMTPEVKAVFVSGQEARAEQAGVPPQVSMATMKSLPAKEENQGLSSALTELMPSANGRGNAFATPLQALIKTVGKVGIKPAAGTHLGPSTSPRRSKRVPSKDPVVAPSSKVQSCLPERSCRRILSPPAPSTKGPGSAPLQEEGLKAQSQAEGSEAPLPPYGGVQGSQGLLPGSSLSLPAPSQSLPHPVVQHVVSGVKRMKRTNSTLRSPGEEPSWICYWKVEKL